MEYKKGQMQLSFGMIFSILIIIVTIAVAFYVIRSFLETSQCAELNTFHASLQKEIDSIWRAATAQSAYRGTLPSSVSSVCFGDSGGWDAVRNRLEREAFSAYRGSPQNFFIYPLQCGRAVSVRQLAHVSIPKGFCVPLVKGAANLTLTKSSSTTAEVTLAP